MSAHAVSTGSDHVAPSSVEKHIMLRPLWRFSRAMSASVLPSGERRQHGSQRLRFSLFITMRISPYVRPPSRESAIHTAWSSLGRSFARFLSLNTCPNSATVPSFSVMIPVGGMPAESWGWQGSSFHVLPRSSLIIVARPRPSFTFAL